jgi:hypothetical protein
MRTGGVCRRGPVLEDSAGTESDSQCTQTASYEQRRWAKSKGLFWFWVKSGLTNVWKNIKEIQITRCWSNSENWSKQKIKHYSLIYTKLMPFGINIGTTMGRFCNCSTGMGWVVRFVCWESVPCTCWGGWVGPRASLDTLENRKFPCPCQVYNHDSLNVQPAVYSLYGPCCPGF